MSLRLDDLERGLNLDIRQLPESEVLFFTGAGISAASPTDFPLGDEFHNLILQYYTGLKCREITKLIESRKFTFEQTCQVISDEYKKLSEDPIRNPVFLLLSAIFQHYEGRLENDYHKYFRTHLNKGGKHCTVNLDQFIELDRISQFSKDPQVNYQIFTAQRAAEDYFNYKGFQHSSYLFKLHGDVNEDYVNNQGFLYEIIKNGFPAATKSFLELTLGSNRLVIFIGYGGVDKFDIIPFFKEKRDKYFVTTKALWIDYSKEKDIVAKEINEMEKNQRLVLSKFAGCRLVKCSPEVVLNQLFQGQTQIQNAHRASLSYSDVYERVFSQNSHLLKSNISERLTKIFRLN